MTKQFGDGTRWRIKRTMFGDWYIYPPLQRTRWVEPARDQLLAVPDGMFPTFEMARAYFAAGGTG